MARNINDQKLNELQNAITNYPEHRASWFAQLLGTDNKDIQRSLVQLERQGYLLAEDDNGRLSWFGRRG